MRKVISKGGEGMSGEPRVTLEFRSKELLREALKIVFEKKVPCVAVDTLTMIVSHDKTSLFKDLEPIQSPVLSASDPEVAGEIDELRAKHLGFQDD